MQRLITSSIYPIEHKLVTDFEIYILYNSLRLHFNQPSYDATKYHFQNKKYNWDTYQKVPMSEVNIYGKMAKDLQTKENVMIALTAHFYYNRPKYVHQCHHDLPEFKKAYQNLKMFLSSPQYFITKDLTIIEECVTIDAIKPKNNSIPKIFHIAQKGIISIESLVVIDHVIGITKYADKHIKSLSWNAYKEGYLKYSTLICNTVELSLTNQIKQTFLKLKNT